MKPSKKETAQQAKVDNRPLQRKLEALLFAAGRPLSLKRLHQILIDNNYSQSQLKEALAALIAKYKDSSIELVKVATGYVFHIGSEYADLMQQLTEERPQSYSRALMETLAVIAYKQPITKAEIEELRGVTLSPNIMRTLLEHEWIRSAGHKNVPGRPILWVTTKHLLDSLKLESLDQLPKIPKIKDKEEEAEEEKKGREGRKEEEEKKEEKEEKEKKAEKEDFNPADQRN